MKELESLEEVQPWKEEVKILKKEVKEEEYKLDFKMLPSHLKYVFLDDGCNKQVIISNALSEKEEYRLVQILKKNHREICWVLSDLKDQ